MQPRTVLLWLVIATLWSPLIALVTGPAYFVSLYPLLAYLLMVLVVTFVATACTVRRLRPPGA
jgi:hypothetical protein